MARDADRRTLARRLYFDLLGLPPSNERVEAFVADPSPDAYARLVDELLRSEHFGERVALYWLDLVRYADTAGYHSDNHRDIAPYRDYVIRAFNSNKPFDQFTREQLAGDLMPNATNEQRIASGFNRLLQTTEEGGAQPKEYTAKYAADRVRKRDASSVDAFDSAPLQPAGSVAGGTVTFAASPLTRPALGPVDATAVRHVPLVTCAPGIDAAAVIGTNGGNADITINAAGPVTVRGGISASR